MNNFTGSNRKTFFKPHKIYCLLPFRRIEHLNCLHLSVSDTSLKLFCPRSEVFNWIFVNLPCEKQYCFYLTLPVFNVYTMSLEISITMKTSSQSMSKSFLPSSYLLLLLFIVIRYTILLFLYDYVCRKALRHWRTRVHNFILYNCLIYLLFLYSTEFFNSYFKLT